MCLVCAQVVSDPLSQRLMESLRLSWEVAQSNVSRAAEVAAARGVPRSCIVQTPLCPEVMSLECGVMVESSRADVFLIVFQVASLILNDAT